MEDKWVTLAIRTYQRATMIKNVLEQNSVETVIHNLNTENPELAVGVRVRIREKDLAKALTIVEEVESAWDEEEKPSKGEQKNMILIPIELTDQINVVTKFGFQMAQKLNTEVVFLHAYLSAAYTITPHTINDFNRYSITTSKTLRRHIKRDRGDVENLHNLVNRWIDIGDIPKIKFRFELKDGVPEDVIYDYCKKNKPSLVVMSTNTQKKKETDMIGSVTAETLEISRVPVIAIPTGIELVPKDIKRIAFFTNFDQNDLIAIDTLISYFEKEDLEIIFLHSADHKDQWDEVMLYGIKAYFSNQYPALSIRYSFLKSSKEMELLKEFLADNKIDLVAMNSKKRSLLSRFFNQGIVSRMLFNVDTPLFVLRK